MIEVLSRYFPGLASSQLEKFEALQSLYADWNSRINVISRKDIGQLSTHHILHSLSIARFTAFVPGTSVIDIGTGGGFPGIPLAIFFPSAEFHLVDSIGKKITVAAAVATSLGLSNVRTSKCRIEELDDKADFTVSRAVSTLSELVHWSRPLLLRTQRNVLANGLICLK